MVEELARLRWTSHENPLAYYYLNLERAAMLCPGASDCIGRPIAVRHAYATELVRGGMTADAIQVLTVDDTGSGSPASEQERTLLDQLAIASLRLGEQQNCIHHAPAGACIIPIRASAIHRLPNGSLQAIGYYERILSRFRSDLSARWLLNVAYMTLGGYPEAVPSGYLVPGLEVDSSDFPFFRNIAGSLGVDLDDLAGGVAVEDFNDDGLPDILATAHRLEDGVRFFLNDGRGGFIDHTRKAGLDGIAGGLNVVHADYDNDGFEDVLVLRGAWLGEAGRHPNSLLRNRGDGTFEDVTVQAGLLSYHPTQTAAWADFNLDGRLDLFIGNEEADRWLGAWQTASSEAPLDDVDHFSELYMNNGDGTFTDVAKAVGIEVNAFVKGVTWGDVDNDGLPDLYVSIIGSPNRLFMNRGPAASSGWRFEEVSAGVHEPFFSFATWFFDFDNDGREDLFVAPYDLRRIGDAAGDVAREYLGYPVETEMPRLYRNIGDGRFEDVTESTGLDRVLFAMGGNFGDLDNDGYLDLYLGTGAPDLRSIIPNRMFRNDNARQFQDVTLAGGFGHIQKGHAVAFADLDRDGDQDVYASMGGVYSGDGFANVLFENPGAWPEHSWIVLDLVGTRANRSAIGARIRLTVEDRDGSLREIHRTVGTGGSFGSSTIQQEIGLGAALRIRELRITWPNRERSIEVFEDLEVSRRYRIVEGRGRLDDLTMSPLVPPESATHR